jgi:hypothetical protein
MRSEHPQITLALIPDRLNLVLETHQALVRLFQVKNPKSTDNELPPCNPVSGMLYQPDFDEHRGLRKEGQSPASTVVSQFDVLFCGRVFANKHVG